MRELEYDSNFLFKKRREQDTKELRCRHRERQRVRPMVVLWMVMISQRYFRWNSSRDEQGIARLEHLTSSLKKKI